MNAYYRYIRAMAPRKSASRRVGPRAARRASPHPVAILILKTVVPFDLGVPCQIFGYGKPDLGAVRYTAQVCAAAPGRVQTSAGFAVEVAHGLEVLDRVGTVIIPGISDLDAPVPQAVLAALRAAYARGARVASICTGAFVLAAAGLLDGRRATTHWQDAPLLAARYPRVTVDPAVLYIDEGRVITSAGVAAGIDLCLHLVRSDYGAAVANAVARRLVVAPHRSGGQAQFAERAVPDARAAGLERTRGWMLEELARPLTVAELAAHAQMSRRTFIRRFRAETGTSPLQWVLHQRVLRAQHLLETTSESLERIAGMCGFGSAVVLRQHFRRVVGTTPLAYRLAFRGQA
jgi:AraC family transcriptional regulator, transcriptional activator FtrA